MPLYEFRDEQGREILIFRKISEGVPATPAGCRRVFGVLGHSGANNRIEESLIESKMQMYRSYERRHGTGSLARDAGINSNIAKRAAERSSKAQLKREKFQLKG